ncbi:tetratricopeptide repeat protein [Clostridium tepidiprofundi DSM 19306]|uniref:Tetratricopeptide repeat protein n=1 Tax=Clostridium tepidiprofundi DSM 19306 TaxID=1121338 RepID=A0A151B2W8_9CLOT|nr:tetratricopeptide repeat protein [Clostridium tepidiprofundi]KYH34007.1 tetratricopeptide repeat protein [Clostridium tepidiprofundi DSM 19306]
MKIEKFLRNIDLEKYIDIFKEEEIEVTDLEKLKEEDYKEMGVKRGPMRRILEAVKNLRDEQITEKDSVWYINLSERKELWLEDAFNEFPLIIAHEYWRLKDLLRNGKTYGAFFQVKDLFEILIKFPVLIAASDIYNKKERSSQENKILMSLLEKPLSLGDWEKLARTIIELDTVDLIIKEILKDIIDVFSKNNIVQWRNNQIGHGALSFDADKEFQKDLYSKIEVLKSHFERCYSNYCKINLYQSTNSNKVILRGKDSNTEIISNSDIFVILEENDKKLYPYILEKENGLKKKLYPYILTKENGIYFFDTFYFYKNITSILNYVEGKKANADSNINELIKAIYTELDRDNKYGIDYEEFSLDCETYSAIEADIIDKLEEIDDFQRPDYIKDWLLSIINANSKGIILIQMERGTGKTTFSRALDELSLNKFKDIKDISIRGYYINDSYSYRVESFTEKLSDLLRQNSSGENIIRGISPLSVSVVDTKKEFARFINEYARAHNKYFGKEKFLLILDGLDEIPSNSDVSIFDFIPSEDILDDNVYVLCTCRTDNELTEYTKNCLNSIKTIASISYNRENKYNNEILMQYIGRNIFQLENVYQFNEKQKQLADILLNKCERRFLYLKAIKELIKCDGNFNIDEVPKGKELFQYYLNKLQSMYGKKYFSTVIKMLVSIATAFEPLTFREISYLLGENRPTFKLLAHLTDLRIFFKVDRSYRGNLITISHDEWKKAVIHNYNEEIVKLIEQWWNNIKELEGMQFEWFHKEYDGELYILSNIIDYYNSFKIDNAKEICNNDFANLFIDIANYLGSNSVIEYHRKIRIKLYSEAIFIKKELIRKNNLQDENEVAEVYINRGMAYRSLMKSNYAIMDYNEAIKIRHSLLKEDKLSDKNDLAIAYERRGEDYRILTQYKKAIEDFDKSIEIRRNLNSINQLKDVDELANVLKNRALALRLIGENEKAFKDLEVSISIRRKLKEEGNLKDENYLASSIMNRGATYLNVQKYDEAIRDYKEATEIRRKLIEYGKLKDTSYLASSLMNLACAYYSAGKYDEALIHCNEAVELSKKLDMEGKLQFKDYITQALVHRGNVYNGKQNYDKAVEDYSEAIILMRELIKGGTVLHNSLINALKKRLEIYKIQKKYYRAIEDCKEIVEILENTTVNGENDFKLKEFLKLEEELLADSNMF